MIRVAGADPYGDRMTTLLEIESWLQDRLPTLLAENDVPGAAIAIDAGGEVIDCAAGVLSTATRVDTTPDTLFQIGSITKLWTATLVMQLADEGAVDLDRPLREYVPEFVLGDERAAAEITVRQLLCHTAGFEGDVFTDTGPGDDCVEKYVSALRQVPQVFAPGELFSYNNAGYCVLGRLVEVKRGKPYDQCLRERLFTPLGLTHAATGPNEAIVHRAAVGHLRPTPGADPVPAPVWAMPRSAGPAGAVLAMRPRDLLAFARMHLAGGTAADGTAVLADASVKAMQEPHVQLPDLGLFGDTWGLGWEIFGNLPGPTMLGHDGSSMGQAAFLRVVPERDVSLAVLTNGGDPFAVYWEIAGRVLRELAGVDIGSLPVPPATPARVDAGRFTGTYRTQQLELVVTQDVDGRIWLDERPTGGDGDGEPTERLELVQLRGDTFLPVQTQFGVHLPHAFVGDDGHGNALYLHNGRAVRRAQR